MGKVTFEEKKNVDQLEILKSETFSRKLDEFLLISIMQVSS